MRTKGWIHRNSLSFGIATFLLFMQFTSWPPLRFWGWWGGGNFQDSWQVLKSADCYRQVGLAVYEVNNPCTLYAYGRPLLWGLRDLHLGASQTSAFGFVFIIVLSFTISMLIQLTDLSKKYQTALAVMIVTSPPVLLLADRGNFDTLIFGVLIVAHILSLKQKNVSALLLVFLITLFKYYTFPILIFLTLQGKSWTNRFIGFSLTSISFLSILRDLKITQFQFTSKDPHLTFGIGHEFLFFARYPGLTMLSENYKLLGIMEVALLSILSFVILRKIISSADFSTSRNNVHNLYIISILVFLTCFISGFNADYRLIYFVSSCLVLLKIFDPQRDIKVSLIVALVAGVWFTFPSGDLEILGDIILSLFASFNLAFLLLTFKLRYKKLFH